MSSLIAGGTVERSQACFLPQSQDGVPVIGKIPSVEGAYIASGLRQCILPSAAF